MRYEDFVRKVCGDNWKVVNEEERDGGYGVACIKAFINGAKPSLGEMANNLGVTTDDIYVPFSRLSRAGAFTRWNVKRDASLSSHSSDDEYWRAWSHVAAVSSGLIGNF